jgi:hypothetical protein
MKSNEDYEELAKLSSLDRVRLLLGSFGTASLFVVLTTFLALPITFFMYYETTVKRVDIERVAAFQQMEVRDRTIASIGSLDKVDVTVRTLLSNLISRLTVMKF